MTNRLTRTLTLVGVLLAGAIARAQAPDFDAVAWQPLACGAGDATGDESPASVDLVGDATYLAAYVAHDSTYLYFRYRTDGNPVGAGGFDQYSWVALMQVPSGDPFQYQYELSLNGKLETLEVWANTVAKDIDFSPLFSDTAEVKLVSEPVATLPLARHTLAADGSHFGGSPDYFADFAFPIADLVGAGVIASASDLDGALFFPATSTNPNNYNKGHLDCAFAPGTTLAVAKSVAPTVVPANATTPLAYTIAVHNVGATAARGVVVEDPQLPSYLANANATVSADDPSVTWTVVSSKPLEVRVPTLPVGATVTVVLSADATPGCGSNGFTNVADAFATNAPLTSGSADLAINYSAGGCAACTSDADCDDSNACTTDACVAGACTSTPAAGCTPCAVDADCDDANACTTDTCVAGTCQRAADPTCTPCAVDTDCTDGDACTADACVAGVCGSTPIPACSAGACTVDADCGDGDVCTTDTCVAGTCAHASIPGCGGPESACADGVDNDGDGLTDCADPDCADSPACGGPKTAPKEICGDCIDNDGDGLVDYDDPDCCDQPMALEVRRMTLKSTAKKPTGTRLNLRTAFADYTPAGLDPMAGATVQVSDAAGMIFCQTMPAAAWKHPQERLYRFRDKTGTLAGGLKRGRFKMKKTGAVMFRTRGRGVTLRATEGHDVKVTVGVGGQCSQSVTQLRAARHAMVLP